MKRIYIDNFDFSQLPPFPLRGKEPEIYLAVIEKIRSRQKRPKMANLTAPGIHMQHYFRRLI